ncbi:MAG: hypothetical protein IKF52_03670, partial [Clostridia bacterium]|nr:hypothetical protein [Clostridia bacterium]
MKFEDKFDEILDDEKLINVIEKYSLYNRELYDIITEPLYDREENQNDYIKNFNKWILPDLKKGGNSMYGKSELQIKAKQFINNFSNHKRNYKKVISRYKNPDEPGIHIFSEHYNDSGFKLCLDIGEDTYEFAKRFEIKCMEKNINFSYRVMDPYEHDEIYRTDKLTVYCDEMNYSLYLRILEQIREENELLDYREPPILTENIDNWVGIAQNGSRESYESKMAKSMDIAFADVYDGVYRDRIFEYAKIYRATLDEVRKDVKGLFPVIEEYFKHEEDEIRDNDEEYKTEEDEKYVFEEFLEEREEKNEEDIEENEQEEYEEEIEENEQEEYEEEIEENEQEEYEEEIEE